MNLFDLFVKIGVDDQASSKIGSLTSKLGDGLKSAAKIGLAAVGAAASGIAALTTASINNYAEYEQLVGGVETLFKDSANVVQEYAANAYKTAGLSANDYMSTVTSFSASLLQGLNGDTAAAAKIADQAIVDMSDNANKMGTDISMIQNAYQGFAKQNYTMLDNLKLGYGGTASEMARLVNDSGVLGDSIEVTAETINDVSFDKIIEAIHVVQTEMGITGTTAKEASSTISGSFNSMKSAWSNLMTGIADENADFDNLIQNLVGSVSAFGENILPRVEVALNGAAQLIDSLLPVVVEKIPGIIQSVVPQLANSAINIVQSLIDGIRNNIDMLVQSALDVVTTLADGILEMLPEIAKLGLEVLTSLANGIADELPTLVPVVIDTVMSIVEVLTDPNTLLPLVDAALAIVVGLATGIIDSLPELISRLPVIITNIVTTLVGATDKIADAGVTLLTALIANLPEIVWELVKAVPQIIGSLLQAFANGPKQFAEMGVNLIKGLWEGISSVGDWLWDKISGFFESITDGIKEFFGINSPSTLFRDEIGKMLPRGVGVGFDAEMPKLERDINKQLHRLEDNINTDFNIHTTSIDDGAPNRTGIGGRTVSVIQNIYSEAKSAADLMREAVFEQEMVVMMGV